MSNVMLKVEDLHVAYGQSEALHCVSFEGMANETVAIECGARTARPRPAAAAQGPPRRAGGVPLPALRSKAREGGSGVAAQADVPHLSGLNRRR